MKCLVDPGCVQYRDLMQKAKGPGKAKNQLEPLQIYMRSDFLSKAMRDKSDKDNGKGTYTWLECQNTMVFENKKHCINTNDKILRNF